MQNKIKSNNSPALNTFQRVGLLGFRSWELMEETLYVSKKRICSMKCYPVHRWEIIFSNLSYNPPASEVRMRTGEFPTFGREVGNNLREGDPKTCCRMELHTFAQAEVHDAGTALGGPTSPSQVSFPISGKLSSLSPKIIKPHP